MKAFLTDRFTIAWLLLVAVTLVSVSIGSAGTAGPAVLTIAMGKVAMVIFTFMEVRSAPVILRAACAVWLLAVTGVLLALYFGVLP